MFFAARSARPASGVGSGMLSRLPKARATPPGVQPWERSAAAVMIINHSKIAESTRTVVSAIIALPPFVVCHSYDRIR
jgi:hypothetical protein